MTGHIGQAKKYLKSKIYEHKYLIRTENCECTMLLASHSTNLRHNFYFSNAKILDKESNLEKRLDKF